MSGRDCRDFGWALSRQKSRFPPVDPLFQVWTAGNTGRGVARLHANRRGREGRADAPPVLAYPRLSSRLPSRQFSPVLASSSPDLASDTRRSMRRRPRVASRGYRVSSMAVQVQRVSAPAQIRMLIPYQSGIDQRGRGRWNVASLARRSAVNWSEIVVMMRYSLPVGVP